MKEAPTAVLLDVEGTTTSIDFVYRVLFPFARARALPFLRAHAADPEVAAEVRGLADEHRRDAAAGHKPPAWEDSPEAQAAYVCWLIDRDRKATSLKALQGRMWEEGFRDGVLQGQVYADVPRALARWTSSGRTVAIFSSGSVRAQKLLFAHTQAGDLTSHLSAFFDTTTGFKTEPDSYRDIARALDRPAQVVLFVSDVNAELDAAHAAGMQTALASRSDTLPVGATHRIVTSFDQLP